jgi:hypothetical protein
MYIHTIYVCVYNSKRTNILPGFILTQWLQTPRTQMQVHHSWFIMWYFNLNNWKLITHLCHSYGQSLAYYNFTLIALTFNLSTELWLDYKQQKNLHTFMSSSRRQGVNWSACWKLAHKTASTFVDSLVKWARSNSSICFSHIQQLDTTTHCGEVIDGSLMICP